MACAVVLLLLAGNGADDTEGREDIWVVQLVVLVGDGEGLAEAVQLAAGTPGGQHPPKELEQLFPGGHTHWLLQQISPTLGLKQKRLPFGAESAQVW